MPGTRWSEHEKEQLRQALESGQRISDVQVLARRPNAIRAQAIRMGLIEPNEPRLNWSLRQRRLLKKYWRLGLKPEEIHDHGLLGEPYRSLWSIKKKWGRMKLADRRRARKMRRKKVWRPGEKESFNDFLLKHSDRMTPEQIGNLWGVVRSTVARWQEVLGVKRPRDTVLLMDYSLDKQRRARQRIRRFNIKSAAQRRAKREADLQEMAAAMRTRRPHLLERTCVDCDRSWPLRSAFFHPTDRRTDFGTSRYYKRRCRLCENRRRRERDQKRRARRKPKGATRRSAA